MFSWIDSLITLKCYFNYRSISCAVSGFNCWRGLCSIKRLVKLSFSKSFSIRQPGETRIRCYGPPLACRKTTYYYSFYVWCLNGRSTDYPLLSKTLICLGEPLLAKLRWRGLADATFFFRSGFDSRKHTFCQPYSYILFL